MTDAPPSFRHMTLAGFVGALASSASVPGGGSASAVAGSLAAALVRMVVALSLERPRYAPYDATLRRVDGVAERSLDRLLSLADEDAAAYAVLASAFRMPRDGPEQKAARDEAIRSAARGAALAPLEILRAAHAVAAAAEAIAGRSNVSARSDVASAASLAEAAARGAAANVLVNLPLAGDDAFAETTSLEVARLVGEAETLAALARDAAAGSALREPEAG